MSTTQVPQFIDMEAKIIGPLTLRQFLFIAAGGGLIFGLSFILQTGLLIIVGLFIAALSIALAFVKINEQPLYKVIINAFKFYISPRLYTWKRQPKSKELTKPIKPIVEKPKTQQKRLTPEELQKIAEELENKK